MIRLAALLAITAGFSVHAQITASPTAITVYMRKLGTHPLSAGRGPSPTVITISGTGSWNMARSGTLSTACSDVNGYCFNAVSTVTTTCSGSLPTGSGAGTTNLCWNGLVTSQLGVGTHTGTLTIGSTAIAITLIVQAAEPYSTFVYSTGYPSGCSTTSGYANQDNCTITNERPTSGAFSIPAAGAGYNDPQFGNQVTRLTANTRNIQYGAVTAFSATNKYVMTSNLTGTVYIYTRATGVETYTLPAGININFAGWDPSNDEIVWFMENGTIKYRDLAASSTTTAADYSLSSGARPAMTSITMGGTVDITDDGWWAFWNQSTTLCAVNLNGLTTGTQESKTYCGSISSYNITDVDFPQVTQVDRESNKRYVVAVGSPQNQVFRVDLAAGTLVHDYAIPLGSADVTAAPHMDVGQDRQGRQLFYWFGYGPTENQYYLASLQLNKGTMLTRPVEEGGGWRYAYPLVRGTVSIDGHFGCNWRGQCLGTPYITDQVNAYSITAITAASPCAVTTSANHGYSTGASVGVAGVTGTSGANGIHTITVTSSTTFTMDGSSCSGTYTAGSGFVAANTGVTNYSNRSQVILTDHSGWSRPIFIHRGRVYGNALNTYYQTARCSLSRDAAYVACASNLGASETASVYVASTGYSATQVPFATADPADTSAILNYTWPTATGTATVVISTSPALSSPVVNASDGSSAQARQYVATGLTASTTYYYRISTPQWAVSGQFRTLAALSGTGRLTVAKGGGGTINYGTTVSLGSSCTSPCDLAPARGILYTNASSVVRAVVVR